jgi:serine/threonine-protein phosphatase 2B regulatory subunit
MGSRDSKLKKISDYELNEFARQSDLSFEEIKNLHLHFKAISSMEKDDGVIDYEEFCSALKIEKSLIADRFFQIFDLNHDLVLNFREFVLGISVLINSNFESLLKITFSIFDIEKVGEINKQNFKDLILSCLVKLPTIQIKPEILQTILDETFDEINKEYKKASVNENKDGKMDSIDFNQYAEMIKKNPQILKWLQIDLDKIKSGADLLLKDPKKFTKRNMVTF